MSMTAIEVDARVPLLEKREAEQLLVDARDQVEPAYRSAVALLHTSLGHIASYHIGWCDTEGRPQSNRGKTVRPAFVLGCARAVSGDAGVEPSLPAAVAVELVHDFSLLHDDVMDMDPMRRHRTAAWKAFGVGPAILTGDALLALAFKLIGNDVMNTVLSETLLELCAGQATDLEFEERDEVTLQECLTLAEEKTGALLGAACQLGALAAGAGPAVAVMYREFGRNLGVAFQLVDDLLGINGDPSRTGKPVGADLLRRKKSLPVVAAMNAGGSAGSELLRIYRSERELGGEDIEHLRFLIDKAGGLAWAQAEANRRTAVSLALLRDVGARPDAERALWALADLIRRRDR